MSLEKEGVKAKSLDWISKRVKRNNEWRTEITQTLRIEFETEPPALIFLGQVKYKVRIYTPEIIKMLQMSNVWTHRQKLQRS